MTQETPHAPRANVDDRIRQLKEYAKLFDALKWAFWITFGPMLAANLPVMQDSTDLQALQTAAIVDQVWLTIVIVAAFKMHEFTTLCADIDRPAVAVAHGDRYSGLMLFAVLFLCQFHAVLILIYIFWNHVWARAVASLEMTLAQFLGICAINNMKLLEDAMNYLVPMQVQPQTTARDE